MRSAASVDGVLVQWGERLFCPANRVDASASPVRLHGLPQATAADIRARIEATVARRAPQVMVRVTGGGRGMSAIAAHFGYISLNGRLPMEDDRGVVRSGREALRDAVEQWRYGGSMIMDAGHRREAKNITLSMPAGTDPRAVLQATRQFAEAEVAQHRYLMVLHEHQAHPHVHLCVRVESMAGVRLAVGRADLHRWRETFAQALRSRGVDAEATRQWMRGANAPSQPLWRAREQPPGPRRTALAPPKSGDRYLQSRNGALRAWAHLMQALDESPLATDRALAQQIGEFVRDSDYYREVAGRRHPDPRDPRDPTVSAGARAPAQRGTQRAPDRAAPDRTR